MICATMTRGAALNILRRHNSGLVVGLSLYEQARATIRRGYDRPASLMPKLRPSERERANAVLLFNLGLACRGPA